MIGSGAKRSCKLKPPLPRAVARSENCGWHVVLGGDNVPPLVWMGLTGLPKSGANVPPLVGIGLTGLPKTGWAHAPPAPLLETGLLPLVSRST
jgi:hypothetical protein